MKKRVSLLALSGSVELVNTDLGVQKSLKPNENVDWAKFQAYARRVKSINIGPESLAMFHKRRPPPDISLFTNHPFGDSLFLQLRTVKLNACCCPCLQLMAPFLSPSITRMELELKLLKEEAGPLFDWLQHRAPNIKELVVTSRHKIGDVGLPLSQWISSLQHLTKLSLPPHYQSKDIVAAAGGLKGLKIFNLVDDTGPLDEDGMQMELLPDTFPMLRALEWNSTLPKAFQLLQPSPRVEALKSLYLDSACNNTPVEFVAFTRLLGEACPRLCELWLNLFPDLEADPEPYEKGLEVDALHGLAPCKELELLQIGHPFPIKLRERDVRWIGATWKKLDCLVLCPDPDLSLDIPPWMGTSISLLPLLANHLPNLTTLGLWFAGEVFQIINFSGDLYPQYQFKNMQKLQVGLSPLPQGGLEDLGFLIASLCGLAAPTIDTKCTDWYRGEEPSSEEPRRQEWKQVGRSLDLAMRTKVCGWERIGRAIA